MSGTECGDMGAIILDGGQSVEPWEPSSLRGGRVCGDRMEWLVAISDGGGIVRAAIPGFMRKQ